MGNVGYSGAASLEEMDDQPKVETPVVPQDQGTGISVETTNPPADTKVDAKAAVETNEQTE